METPSLSHIGQKIRIVVTNLAHEFHIPFFDFIGLLYKLMDPPFTYIFFMLASLQPK